MFTSLPQSMVKDPQRPIQSLASTCHSNLSVLLRKVVATQKAKEVCQPSPQKKGLGSLVILIIQIRKLGP